MRISAAEVLWRRCFEIAKREISTPVPSGRSLRTVWLANQLHWKTSAELYPVTRHHQSRGTHEFAALPAEKGEMAGPFAQIISFEARMAGKKSSLRAVNLISQLVNLC